MSNISAKHFSTARSLRGGAQSAAVPFIISLPLFLAICLLAPATIRVMDLVLVALTLFSLLPRFKTLRDRMSLPLIALALYLLICGISTFYAVSGKFALNEFTKLLGAFCLTLLLLAWAPEGRGQTEPARWIATATAWSIGWIGLVSVDLISTRAISGVMLGIIGLFTDEYTQLTGIEAGVRILGMFESPNVFAGTMGLGVILSLSLAATAETPRERTAQVAVLYVNALAFLLVFSMGASAFIALGFLVLLFLEKRERRGDMLVRMAETLVLCAAAAAVISATSFTGWTAPRPLPLLCLVLGAAALCLLDRFAGVRLAEALRPRGRLVSILILVLVAVLLLFALAAYHLTGPVSLSAGESLLRAAYPGAGTYTLTMETDRPLEVVIYSQNEQETIMHTNTLLYQGDAAGAVFTVPEGSRVTYFTFTAPEGADVRAAAYDGAAGGGTLPLRYKLLPGFIANRLQGLWANQNAIQRTVFFADGLKLWREAPVFGLGIGAFENKILGVQSFFYETKYAHNHYIQALAETGIVGALLFVAVLAVSAVCLAAARRKETFHPLLPGLGAALVFMAGHAAVELVFSAFCYLPAAFTVFALIGLCCGDALPKPRLTRTARTAALAGMLLCTVLFTGFLIGNIAARRMVDRERSGESLVRAINLDKFEWADYMLSFVVASEGPGADSQVRALADQYAARLEQVNSNTIPYYLAQYYLIEGRYGDAFDMLEQYTGYVSSKAEAWQQAFDLLRSYSGAEAIREGVRRLNEQMEAYNAASMEPIVLSDETAAFVAAMLE